MKFVVSSAVLSKQLTAISGVIVSNPIVPILENFLFEVEQGQLLITASDLQTFVTARLSVDTQEEASVAIPARILIDTLKNLPEQPITFTIDPGTYSVEINASNGHYRLAGENATDFPKLMPVTNGISVEIPANTLKRAISQTIVAVGNDELRPAINGIHVDFQEQGVTFVATDAHRLVRHTRSDIGVATQQPLLIPEKTLKIFNSLLQAGEEYVDIAFNDHHVHFQLSGISMISRLIHERYPDYENVIPAHNPNELVIDRLALLSSLKRIAIYANKTTCQVKLGMSPGDLLQVFAEDFEFSNEASEQLTCEYKGEALETGFNAKLFMELLNSIHSNEIVMRFSEPSKAVLIFPLEKEEAEDTLLLIMPIIAK
ncbi:MAG: DNA polymerase III subunit beta [Bacteroidota bacterium]